MAQARLSAEAIAELGLVSIRSALKGSGDGAFTRACSRKMEDRGAPKGDSWGNSPLETPGPEKRRNAFKACLEHRRLEHYNILRKACAMAVMFQPQLLSWNHVEARSDLHRPPWSSRRSRTRPSCRRCKPNAKPDGTSIPSPGRGLEQPLGRPGLPASEHRVTAARTAAQRRTAPTVRLRRVPGRRRRERDPLVALPAAVAAGAGRRSRGGNGGILSV